MNIAVLFTKRANVKRFCKDWQGRESNDDAYSIINALKELGHNILIYDVNLNLFEKLKKDRKKIDIIFNICDDGFFCNSRLEPHIPAVLDILGLPYTGADYLTLAMTMNKEITKNILISKNLPTPKFQVFSNENETLNKDLIFPLIVKPVKEDASIGIKDNSVVFNNVQLKKQIIRIKKDYNQEALVEEFIDGREFNIGIIGDKDKEVLPVSEVVFENFPKGKPKIINYDGKWNEKTFDFINTKRECPAEINEELERNLIKLALKSTEHFSCRDYYRVDFRVDKCNNPHILEINQNPDIDRDSGLAAMAAVKGYSYTKLIEKILNCAIQRKISRGK